MPDRFTYMQKTALAELVGIMLGDGNLYVRKNPKIKPDCYSLTIAGNSLLDTDYMSSYIPSLLLFLFDVTPTIYKSKARNCLNIKTGRKFVIENLILAGLTPGDKLKNKVTIPSWILKDQKFLKACIRGLYDTDGSVYELLPHWPGLFQLSFDNRNMTLLNDLRNSLLQLGFHVSKICSPKNGKTPKIYITRKSDISKYVAEIGFSNIKHYRKVQKVFPNAVLHYSPVV